MLFKKQFISFHDKNVYVLKGIKLSTMIFIAIEPYVKGIQL